MRTSLWTRMTDFFDSPSRLASRAVALLVSAAVCGHCVAADSNAMSATGIPIDYLFGVIAALVSLVYMDIKREIRHLHHNARTRAKHIRHVENTVRTLCNGLAIPYEEVIEDE